MRKRNLLASIILIITSILAGTLYTYKDGIFDLYRYSRSAVSYYGSRSQEVVEIQTRLKKWGYYDGKIDGVYGIKTYRAVRKFQAKNGLKVDGVAGSQTLAALGIPTGSTGQSSDNNNLKSAGTYNTW